LPSVDITWLGKCTDRLVQENLVAKICEFSEISGRFYREFYHEEPKQKIYEDLVIDDKTPIARYLFMGESVSKNIHELDSRDYLGNDISLYGVEFTLFDPRVNRAESSVMSFVFIRSSNEYLDGRMVSIVPLDTIGPINNYCPFRLSIPSLDVRYYLDHWINEFLSWVKRFYISNLHFCDPDGFFGYNEYKNVPLGDPRTKDKIFQKICHSFEEEATDFSTDILEEKRLNANDGSEKSIKVK
jgi:hypothetical protein